MLLKKFLAALMTLVVVLASSLLALPFVAAGESEPLYFTFVSGGNNSLEHVRSFGFKAGETTVDGIVSQTSVSELSGSPGYMAWSPDRTVMYGGQTGNAIGAFSINPSDGKLTKLGNAATFTGATVPTHLSVHPSGKWVFAAYYGSGHVASFSVNADGSMKEAVSFLVAGGRAHMAIPNRAGTRLYVPCLGSDYIAIYDINDGVLDNKRTVSVPSISPRPVGLDPLQGWPGPRHMAFNSDETRAYVINENESTMTTFTHDPSTGALTLTLASPSAISTLPSGYTGTNTAAHVVVSPNGTSLYGSNRTHDSIVHFAINPATGAISSPQWYQQTGEIATPRNFTVDPSGTVLLCANSDSNFLTVFRITPSTGALTRLGTKTVGKRTFVGVMPNRSKLSRLEVTPKNIGLTIGGVQDFDAVGYDQFDQKMSTLPTVTWSVSGVGSGNITPAGVFTATVAGNATITAQAGGLNVTATADISLPVNQKPTATQPTATPSHVSGKTTELSVMGADDKGEAALKYSWSKVSGPGAVTYSANGTNAAKKVMATFSQVGDYEFEAVITDADNASVTSNKVKVTVTATLTSLIISPTSTSVQTGQKQQFSVSRRDQFNQDMGASSAVVWSATGGGTISTTGEYTAPPSGTSVTITAKEGAIEKTAAVTLTTTPNKAPTVATEATATPSSVSGKTTELSVLGADDKGEAALKYTWSKVSGLGAVTFSVNGTNEAKKVTATFAQEGDYQFETLITDADNASIPSNKVTVKVNATLTSLIVSPTSASVKTGEKQQFSVIRRDQFDQDMGASSAVVWSVTGGGTISATGGLYTASTVAGDDTILATEGSIKSDAVKISILSSTPVTPPVSNDGGGKSCGLGAGLGALVLSLLVLLRVGFTQAFRVRTVKK
jgi:6-phosphogluconolactonase